MIADATAADSGTGDAHLARLVGLHGDDTWRLARHALGGRDDLTARAVEDAWSVAWAELPARDTRVPERLWLLGLVARACEGLDPLPALPEPGPDEEPWRALGRDLDALPWGQRVAWLLVEVHGLEVSEVAVTLDLPEVVVRHLVDQAHRTLSGSVAARANPPSGSVTGGR